MSEITAEKLLLTELLELMVTLNSSDLFISAGDRPYFRVDGALTAPKQLPKLTASDSKRLCYSMLKDAQKKQFEEELELDLSFSYRGVGRFRANLFFQKGCVSGALRLLPSKIIPLEYLGLPEKTDSFIEKPHGLILVTGGTGSGKSTTLASFIDRINEKFAKHIITIEDPIEYVHQNKKSLMEQREIHADTHSFHNALRYVLRQNPDVVVVGEMRDAETMEAAMTMADTGHLTFGTLHTNNCVQTITRLVDSFPADKQAQVRTQLSFVLEGVISQTLIPKQYERGRVLACEVMFMTPGIRNHIRTGKIEQIYSELQVSGRAGSLTMATCLADLYRKGLISVNQARYKCDPDKLDELERLIGEIGTAVRRPVQKKVDPAPNSPGAAAGKSIADKAKQAASASEATPKGLKGTPAGANKPGK